MKTIFIRQDTILQRITNKYGGFVLGGIFGLIIAYMFAGALDRSEDINQEILLAQKSATKHCNRRQTEQVMKDVGLCTSRGEGDNHCWNWAIIKDCEDEK
ncbi:MAG TPA: hypothetical protein VFM18_07935 [Methanosarcina sp.]|nr:hypothetical protein [Methanosarcina sp.]